LNIRQEFFTNSSSEGGIAF